MVPFYVVNSMGLTQILKYELTVTLTYTLYLMLIELLLMLVPIPKSLFWYVFILMVIDSVMYDVNNLEGYISLGVQILRVVSNVFTAIVACTAALLILNYNGIIKTTMKSNLIDIHIVFDDQTYLGLIGFTFFIFFGLAATFTILRTLINTSITIGKTIAVLFGKIEIEDEIPILADEVKQLSDGDKLVLG